MIVLSLILLGALFGAIGVWIARNKRADPIVGFALGAFLGPFGLIVVALLNPVNDTASDAPRISNFDGHPSLSNDAYKLWLVSHYQIQRNDVLSAYVWEKKLFPSIEAALEFAHGEYSQEFVQREADESTREQQRAAAAYDQAERYKEAATDFKKAAAYAILGGAAFFGSITLASRAMDIKEQRGA